VDKYGAVIWTPEGNRRMKTAVPGKDLPLGHPFENPGIEHGGAFVDGEEFDPTTGVRADRCYFPKPDQHSHFCFRTKKEHEKA
jgi:hypothetical protein